MNTKRRPHTPNYELRIKNSEFQSPCPYSARCGGCSRVHIPYSE